MPCIDSFLVIHNFMVDSTYAEKTQSNHWGGQYKYWVCTPKFGVKIPKSVAESKSFDEDNGNTLWWDSICIYINNAHPEFETWEGDTS